MDDETVGGEFQEESTVYDRTVRQYQRAESGHERT